MSVKRNIVLNGLGQIGNRVVRIFDQLLLVPFFLSVWGAAYYGEWLTLTIIPSVLAFSDLGFGTAISNHFVLMYSNDDKEGASNAYFTGIIITSLTIILGLMLSVVVIFCAWNFGMLKSTVIDAPSIFISLAFMMTARLINFYAQLHEGLFRAVHKAVVAYNYFSIEGFMRIAVGVICLLCGCGVIGYALGQLCVAVVFNLLFAIMSYRCVDIHRGHFDSKIAVDTFKKGVGFMLTPVWQSVYLQGSTFAVRIVLGAESVAVFNTVRTVCQSVNSAFSIINGSIFPELQIAYGKKDLLTAKKILTFSLQLVTILSLFGFMVLVILGPTIYQFWTNNTVNVDNIVFYMFMFGIPFNAIWWTSGTAFRAINKPMSFSVYGFISSLISTISVYILSKYLGIMGAAIGFTIMDICMTLFIVPLSNKEFGMTFRELFDFRRLISNTKQTLKVK